MKSTIITCALGAIILSCNLNKEKIIPMNNVSNSEMELYRKLAIEKGDTIAYKELELENYESDSFLYVSLIMANKYNYPSAYYNVFHSLVKQSNKKELEALDDLDEITKKMAIDYLMMGAEKGDKQCQNILGIFYLEGKYLKKDVEKGNRLIEDSKE
ncbi:hypothetical protein [Flavobacterium alvei]|uniref:hypothetical protein n=1 Tax=Flavobacterium alvei TaxID=2080416 RepID=UPI0026EE8C1E|nr:hypothetical protein [Flavobacterium alvei]